MPKAADNSVSWHSQLTHLDFAPESLEWFTWLTEILSFHFESKRGTYTARKERRAQGGNYWIAYVKYSGELYKKHLGPTEKLTIARLEEVAEELTKQMGNAGDHEVPKGSPTASRSRSQP